MRELFGPNPDEPEIRKLIDRLSLHAHWRLHQLTWRGATISKGGAVPGGSEAADFAAQAILKAMDETRTWNHDAYPTLEAFLRSIVDSDINHLADSLDNAHSLRLEFGSEGEDSIAICDREGNEPDPLQVTIDEASRAHYRTRVLQILNGDTLLVEVFRCYEAEVTQPAEIASRLGCSVTDIYRAKKKLQSTLSEVDLGLRASR